MSDVLVIVPEGATQAQTVLAHLTQKGSISGYEASTVYKIVHLPRRIGDLRLKGHQIRSDWHRDPTGKRYVRYFLESAS